MNAKYLSQHIYLKIMRLYFLYTIVAFLLIVGFQPKVINAQSHYTGQTIQEILSLPDQEIDLGLGVLVLAKEAYPNMNVNRFLDILNYKADRIEFLLQGTEDPEVRIGMMNSYLFNPDWWNDSIVYAYDIDDLRANNKSNQFLNGLISTRRGSCITLPMLWLVVADRLGWPVYAVQSTKHYFVRYEDDRLSEKNIDATANGGFLSDRQYQLDGRLPDNAIENGAFLRSLTRKEYLASLLVNQARHHYERQEDLSQAIAYLELAISIDSTLSPAWWNAGIHYLEKAKRLDTEWDLKLNTAYESAQAELMLIARRSSSTNSFPTISVQPDIPIHVPLSELASPKPHQFIQPTSTIQMSRSNEIRTSSPIYPSQNHSIPRIDPMLIEEMNEQLRNIAHQLESHYLPIIMKYAEKSKEYRKRAQDIGISFDFTEDFLIKQQQSIEVQFQNENN